MIFLIAYQLTDCLVRIEHFYVNFLVGGGDRPGKCNVLLHVLLSVLFSRLEYQAFQGTSAGAALGEVWQWKSFIEKKSFPCIYPINIMCLVICKHSNILNI